MERRTLARVEPPHTQWQLSAEDADPGDDLVGVGADLAPGTVLAAYRAGLFPMHLRDDNDDELLGWWSPDPRGVLPLDGVRITRSLTQSMRRFRVTTDHAFQEVMQACADQDRSGRWITPQFLTTYVHLHELGWAHSVEVWSGDGSLVGGLYGIEVGGLFAGESMFHTERDASKVALVGLVRHLNSAPDPDRLLDVQWQTDHLATLGVIEVPRLEYFDRLKTAVQLPPVFVVPEVLWEPH